MDDGAPLGRATLSPRETEPSAGQAASLRPVARDRQSPTATSRVARNALAPTAAMVLNRTLSWGLAIYMARALGPAGNGAYAFAQNLWFFFSVLADFGLGTLLTREAARAPDQSHRLLANTLALRLLFSVSSLPPLLFLAIALRPAGAEPVQLLATVALLGLGLLPGAVAAALTSLYYAREEMGYPALVQAVSGVLSVTLGALALFLGYGIVGLGGASLVTNLVTAGLFLTRPALRKRREARDERQRAVPTSAPASRLSLLALERPVALPLLAASLPLLLSALLNSLFFRIDIQLLAPQGSEVLGYYANAYKFIEPMTAVLLPNFVLALFPLLTRQAAAAASPTADYSGLKGTYQLALKLLLAAAWPAAAAVTFLAYDLTALFWGAAFLPHSAIALQILIWFLPWSFFNGLTQYVLIALGLQRRITLAFALAAGFNVAANSLLIPRWGYGAAAAVTVASELVLLIPFYVAVRARLHTVPLLGATWRPIVAATAMAAVAFALPSATPAWRIAATLAGAAVYVGAFSALRPLTANEWRVLRGLWAKGQGGPETRRREDAGATMASDSPLATGG